MTTRGSSTPTRRGGWLFKVATSGGPPSGLLSAADYDELTKES